MWLFTPEEERGRCEEDADSFACEERFDDVVLRREGDRGDLVVRVVVLAAEIDEELLR